MHVLRLIPVLLLLCVISNDSKKVSLKTTSGLLKVSPLELSNFLATPANWPEIVLSSASVQTSKVRSDVPLTPGECVEETFGLPPILPLSVNWTCEINEEGQDQGRILSFHSPNGLNSVASDCRMFFSIDNFVSSSAFPTQSLVTLEMSFEALSPLVQLAIPILRADNYFALNILLPRALQRRQVPSRGDVTSNSAKGNDYKQSNVVSSDSDGHSNMIVYRSSISEADISQFAVLVSESFDTVTADAEVKRRSIQQFEIDLSIRLKRLVLQEDSNYHFMLGAFDGEKCVGFLEMGMQPMPDEVATATTKDNLVATIGTIAVSKSHRRQGIAQNMMIKAESEIKGWKVKHSTRSITSRERYRFVFDKIICSVDSTNTGAETLYVKKMGYKRKGLSNVRIRKDGKEENKIFLLLCKEFTL